jgi:hypothetical protein
LPSAVSMRSRDRQCLGAPAAQSLVFSFHIDNVISAQGPYESLRDDLRSLKEWVQSDCCLGTVQLPVSTFVLTETASLLYKDELEEERLQDCRAVITCPSGRFAELERDCDRLSATPISHSK